jgi:hypothetical protein
VSFARIPAELRELPRWVVWRWRDVDPKTGKQKKEPYRADAPNGPKHASNKKPEDWTSFEQAVTVVKAGGADGIGFALAPRERARGANRVTRSRASRPHSCSSGFDIARIGHASHVPPQLGGHR